MVDQDKGRPEDILSILLSSALFSLGFSWMHAAEMLSRIPFYLLSQLTSSNLGDWQPLTKRTNFSQLAVEGVYLHVALCLHCWFLTSVSPFNRFWQRKCRARMSMPSDFCQIKLGVLVLHPFEGVALHRMEQRASNKKSVFLGIPLVMSLLSLKCSFFFMLHKSVLFSQHNSVVELLVGIQKIPSSL